MFLGSSEVLFFGSVKCHFLVHNKVPNSEIAIFILQTFDFKRFFCFQLAWKLNVIVRYECLSFIVFQSSVLLYYRYLYLKSYPLAIFPIFSQFTSSRGQGDAQRCLNVDPVLIVENTRLYSGNAKFSRISAIVENTRLYSGNAKFSRISANVENDHLYSGNAKFSRISAILENTRLYSGNAKFSRISANVENTHLYSGNAKFSRISAIVENTPLYSGYAKFSRISAIVENTHLYSGNAKFSRISANVCESALFNNGITYISSGWDPEN